MFSRENKADRFCLIDISSEKISISIVESGLGYLPIVIYKREQKVSQFGDIEKSILISLKDLFNKNHRDIVRFEPKGIKCFLSFPLCKSFFGSVFYSEKESFKFTEDLAVKLLKDGIEKYLKDKNINLRDNEVIEQKISRILLNGYEVNEPSNENIYEAEIDFMVSVVKKKFLKKVENEAQRHINMDVQFYSEILADFISVRDMFPGTKDFITLNMKDKFTEALVVRGSKIVGVVQRANDEDVVEKTLETFDIDRGYLENILSHGLSHMEFFNKDLIDDTILRGFRPNCRKIIKSLLDVSDNEKLPETIYLTSNNMYKAPIFVANIKNIFIQYGDFLHDDLGVIIPGKDNFDDLCLFEDSIQFNGNLASKVYLIQNYNI